MSNLESTKYYIKKDTKFNKRTNNNLLWLLKRFESNWAFIFTQKKSGFKRFYLQKNQKAGK